MFGGGRVFRLCFEFVIFSRCWLIEFGIISANFTLPEESKEGKDGEEGEKSPFKEIIFTELQREEAAKIVAEYNKVSTI